MSAAFAVGCLVVVAFFAFMALFLVTWVHVRSSNAARSEKRELLEHLQYLDKKIVTLSGSQQAAHLAGYEVRMAHETEETRLAAQGPISDSQRFASGA